MSQQLPEKIFPLHIYRSIYYVLSCTNLVLLIISIASPFWIVNHSVEGHYLHSGLWAMCYRALCAYIYNSTMNLNVVRALMIIASASCCLALAVDFLICFVKRKLPKALISSVANNFAGLCTLSSLLIMYLQIKHGIQTDWKYRSPGWVYFITMLSCCLCFILGTLRLLWQRDLDSRNEEIEHTVDHSAGIIKRLWCRDPSVGNQVTPLA